jgi:hypothetical protein
VPGKDNGMESGISQGSGLHNGGEDCGICHSPGRSAENYLFTVSGTIYRDKAGRFPLAGAEVILRDVEGNVISMTTNEVGNFFTYATIAYDPAVGDDPTVPRNWRYKAWIRYGESVRPMVTLAYVGAMPFYVPRMSCNMHHSGMGSRGAPSAGKFQTLTSFPSVGLSFREHVMPILKNRCKACHVPGAAYPYTTYGTESFDYSGGLDLSSYQKDPGSEKGITDVVNLLYPEASLLLAKPHEGSFHGGGGFWSTGDPEYEAIRQWLAEGAIDN